MLIEKCTGNYVDIVAGDLRLPGKGPRKLLPPVLLPTTASNMKASVVFVSQKYDFPAKCLVFISSPFFSDAFSLRRELKKKECMSHVYIKCPLLDFCRSDRFSNDISGYLVSGCAVLSFVQLFTVTL